MSSDRDSGGTDLQNAPEGSSPAQQNVSEEDKPTDYWVPSSASPPQNSPVLDKDFDEHLMELSKPLPRMGDTMIDDSVPAAEPSAPRSEVKLSLAELKADLKATAAHAPAPTVAPAPAPSAAPAPEPPSPSDPEDLDTVEMTADEAAAMLAEMTARAKAMDSPTPATFEGPTVPDGKAPTEGDKATEQGSSQAEHFECRICGKEVDKPAPMHFRGPTTSRRGFSCEKCGIVICAKHTIRTSGFFASLFGHGRFSCQLCNPSRAAD